MSDMELVLAIFDDERAADLAVESLMAWDKLNDQAKAGTIGVLVTDENGKLKEHKLGKARSTAKGAGIGLLLAIVAPPSLLVGLVGGGIVGHFHHPGLRLEAADQERIGAELAGGKAAVGVLVSFDEVIVVSSKLTELGGTVETHQVSDEALKAVEAAAPETTGTEAPGTPA